MYFLHVGNLLQKRLDFLHRTLDLHGQLVIRRQVVGEVLGGVVSHQPAAVDYNDLVADRLHLGQDMGGQDNRVVPAKFLDKGANFDDLLRVESDCRLVQDKHLGVADKRLRQSDTLLVALGQVADNAPGYVGDLHQAANLRQVGFPRQLAFLEIVNEIKVLHHRHVEIERRLLRKVADILLCAHRILQDIHAVDQRLSAGR